MMRVNGYRKLLFDFVRLVVVPIVVPIAVSIVVPIGAPGGGSGSLVLNAQAQSVPATRTLSAATGTTPVDENAEIQALVESVRALQAQVRDLNSQVSELREEQQRARAQTADFRPERAASENVTRAVNMGPQQPSQQPPQQGTAPGTGAGYSTPANNSGAAGRPGQGAPPAQQNLSATAGPNTGPNAVSDRLDKIEEEQQFIDAKINDQYQTKVESGSKYRLRLSGMALLNLYENRGTVDNQDFPEIAVPRGLLDTSGAFGGSLRQSQIGLDVFGPDIAGAHTSANVKFDFAGGFPATDNGATQGLVRLRTGVIRFDWANTSIVGGQDRLFFSPLVPTSLASVAVPALSYAGNLWAWTPQVRVEHRHNLSEDSSLLFQAGILDSMSGDVPYSTFERVPSWGEQSGQPAYAARVAWSRKMSGQDLTIGFGGYYGRQNWGFDHNVDGWASMMDLAVPLGKWFALTGAFYRGRALGGLGGAIGQDVLMSGDISLPTTLVKGLDSVGGWVQLKFKPQAKLEFNGAFGDDNPFASELRRFRPVESYYGVWLSKNLSPFVNVIYQVRSNVVIALEYRHLQTFVLNSGSNRANHINLSLGYMF
jgi:outer membrane murein-binding lipoprotein Lpp